MNNYNEWDWDINKKLVANITTWKDKFSYIEELCVSPNGEKVASIVKNDDMEFTVCVQSEGCEPETWENGYDKIWNLQFTPDGRLSALISDGGEWKVSTDNSPWENSYDFVWNMTCNPSGHIAVSAQKELSYCVVNNDIPWTNEFSRLTAMTLSPDGQKTAAVVESVPVLESEIFKFRKGCYSVAVDGEVWDKNFINVWNPTFSNDSKHVAASVRTSYYDYYIAVDGKTWNSAFSSVWEPRFSPSITVGNNINDYSVTAPVKQNGKWFLAKDGVILWDRPYFQLWHHLYSPDGDKIAAIVAPDFGRWTLALDNIPWEITFSDYISDPIFSPDGSKIACVFKDKGKWGVVVDGKPWDCLFDMVWKPVFSTNGEHLAVKIKKDGFYYVALDGEIIKGKYEELTNPIFSPNGHNMLITGLEGDLYNRESILITS